MARNLKPDEISRVLQIIEELKQEAISEKYKMLLSSLPTSLQAADKKLVADTLELRDSLNKGRDQVTDKSMLRHVVTTEQTHFTDAEAKRIARSLMSKDFLEKIDELEAKFIAEKDPQKRKANEREQELMIDETKNATKSKTAFKTEFLAKKKEMIDKAYEDALTHLEETMKSYDPKIAEATRKRDAAQKKVDEIQAAIIDMTKSRQTTVTTNAGGTTTVVEHDDTDTSLQAKEKLIDSKLSLADAVAALKDAQKVLDQLIADKNAIINQKAELIASRKKVLAELDDLFILKGIATTPKPVEPSEPEKKSETDTEKTSDNQGNGTPVSRKEAKKQERDKESEYAEDFIHALNSQAGDKDILEHIEAGRLDKIAEAKMRIRSNGERRAFEDRIVDLIGKEIHKCEIDTTDPLHPKISIRGRNYPYDEKAGTVTIQGTPIRYTGSARMPWNRLNQKEIEAVRAELEDIFSINLDVLTEPQREDLRHLSNFLQLLVLRDARNMEIRKRLSAIPGFGRMLSRANRRAGAALDIGRNSGRKVHKTQTGREFSNAIREAAGKPTLSMTHEEDAKTINVNGKEELGMGRDDD